MLEAKYGIACNFIVNQLHMVSDYSPTQFDVLDSPSTVCGHSRCINSSTLSYIEAILRVAATLIRAWSERS